MNIIKKLGLLNTFLLLIVTFSSIVLAWELARYYIATEIGPAIRENTARKNTIELAETFEFKPQFETDGWDIYTSETETPLLTVKYPPGCFPVRTYAVGYCSFNKDQRTPSHEAVENEVFAMDYSFNGSDFVEGAKSFIDEKTSSTDPWSLNNLEILEQGNVIVDENKAYLLKIRGTQGGKNNYVYQNYLMFYALYNGRLYPWHLYNESNTPSQYFDTVVSTIRFTQKQK